jgi:methionyl-tRNA synthetase
MFKPVQKLLVTSLLFSAALVAQAAEESAATTPATGNEGAYHEQFMKLDTNKDGFIDAKEAKADKKLTHSFKKIAKNGKLDEPGYESWETQSKKNPKG